MSPVYGSLFRHVAVRVPAEATHRVGIRALRAATPLLASPKLGAAPPDPELAVHAFGVRFPTPLGVAAGYDKDAEGVRGLARLGFGAVEVGTVTARPQPGNPRPRLFRLPADRALINRMGFNNAGADAVAARLAALRAGPELGAVVGVNIGRSKAAEGPAATVADYVYSARTLGPHADYVVVNVSSPNTAGLRDLQGVDALAPLLRAVREALGPTPLLVKITCDLEPSGVDAVADLAVALDLDGIVATNTTVARDGLATDADTVAGYGAGGLSGAPLAGAARAVLTRLRARVGDRLALVSVGGIETGEEAAARLAAGATLVQGYTGFVYGGPSWPGRVTRDLAAARTMSP